MGWLPFALLAVIVPSVLSSSYDLWLVSISGSLGRFNRALSIKMPLNKSWELMRSRWVFRKLECSVDSVFLSSSSLLIPHQHRSVCKHSKQKLSKHFGSFHVALGYSSSSVCLVYIDLAFRRFECSGLSTIYPSTHQLLLIQFRSRGQQHKHETSVSSATSSRSSGNNTKVFPRQSSDLSVQHVLGQLSAQLDILKTPL